MTNTSTTPTSRNRDHRWFAVAWRVLASLLLVAIILRVADVNPLAAMWERVFGAGGSGPEAVQAEVSKLESTQEFRAARGTFSVVLDLTGTGENAGTLPGLLPDFLDGNSAVVQVPAKLDVVADLGSATFREERQNDRRVLVVEVPSLRFSEPQFGDVRVLTENQGLLTRLGDALQGRTNDTDEFNRLREVAGQQAREQATQAGLVELGRSSLTDFLRGMARSSGFDDVDVRIATAPE